MTTVLGGSPWPMRRTSHTRHASATATATPRASFGRRLRNSFTRASAFSGAQILA
jgi:hypothetical protein